MSELPGEQYIPSNSDTGSVFLDGYCTRCARDKSLNGTKSEDDCDPAVDLCDIVNRSFQPGAKAVEWRRIDGGKIICTGYTPMRDPDGASVAVRDELTEDLFK